MHALIHGIETPLNAIESLVYSDFEPIDSLVRHLDAFRDQLDSLVGFILQNFQPAQTRVDPIEANANSNELRVDSVEPPVDPIESRVDPIEARVNSIEASGHSVEAGVNALESRVHGSQTNGNGFSQRVKLLLNSS